MPGQQCFTEPQIPGCFSFKALKLPIIQTITDRAKLIS